MTERPLTFARLGMLGGFGNSLWQLASTVGVARMFDRPLALPPGYAYRPFLSLPDDWFADPVEAEAEDAAHLFWELPPGPKLSRRFAKYGQNRWLWDHAEGEIRAAFAPSPRALAVIDALPQPGPDDVAVHVRRGDYLTMPDYLPTLTEEYYLRAALRMVAESTGPLPQLAYHVFGDDRGWADETFPLWWTWVAHDADGEEPCDWLDLFLMARYSRLAIANSSYSYWAAVLAGPEATVCYPSHWFGPKIDTPHPGLPDWIEVPV